MKKEKSLKKRIKKATKEQEKVIKKSKTTLDWIDIENVHENYVELSKNKKAEVMVGIKIEPHSIFLDNKAEQNRSIHLLRSAFNRLNFDIFHGFVFNPVNLDSHLMMLARQLMIENDGVIKEMLEDDMEKAAAFIQNYRELEFFMMIKGKQGKKLEDQFHQLQVAMQNADLKIKILNRIDFDNLIAYQFENQMINDFYFSRGIFDLDTYMADETSTEEEDDE